jgi:hypothetical protein
VFRFPARQPSLETNVGGEAGVRLKSFHQANNETMWALGSGERITMDMGRKSYGIPEPGGAKLQIIDLATGSNPPASSSIRGHKHQAGWIRNGVGHSGEVSARMSYGFHG